MLVKSKGYSLVLSRTASVTVLTTRPDVVTITTFVWSKVNVSNYNRIECVVTTNVMMGLVE